jgi:hypothetical protein
VPEEAVADAISVANRVAGQPTEIDWLEAKAAAVQRSGLPMRVSAQRIASR